METQKPNAILPHNLFSSISKTIRIFELFIVLILLSWTLTRLPLAVSISADYFRKLTGNPLFIFAVSNVIIAALFAQSGRFTSKNADEHAGAGKLYSEFMNNRIAVSDREHQNQAISAVVEPLPVAAEVMCQDKEVISETVPVTVTVPDREATAGSNFANYRRSQSEKWKGEAGKMQRRKQLRRSETEKFLETEKENLYPQDKLSNEEFQRAIDAFIAKQMRFLREESSAIVVHTTNHTIS